MPGSGMMPARTCINPSGRTTERTVSEIASGVAARSTAAMKARVSSRLRRDMRRHPRYDGSTIVIRYCGDLLAPSSCRGIAHDVPPSAMLGKLDSTRLKRYQSVLIVGIFGLLMTAKDRYRLHIARQHQQQPDHKTRPGADPL